MRHRKAKLRLNRFTSWRRATLASLAKNILIRQSIRTTKAKALAARPVIERLISLGKTGSLAAKRQAYKIVGNHNLVSLIFNEIAPRFKTREGGYTRILNWGIRRGDSAELVILELTEVKKKEPPKLKIKKEEARAPIDKKTEAAPEKEKPGEGKKQKTETVVKEKPPITKKPSRNFLGGLRKIFKKERDSL